MRERINILSVEKSMIEFGTYSGSPAVIVRTQFCDVGCRYCDARESWSLDHVDRPGGPRSYTSSTLFERILQLIEVEEIGSPHIMITGGEPCYYDLRNLTSTFHSIGFTTQIETSGTYPIRCDDRTYVSLSPVISSPSGLVVREAALRRASEIRMPIRRRSDLEDLRSLLRRVDIPDIPVYLIPVSNRPDAVDICINASFEYGYRLSMRRNQQIGLS